MTFFLTGGVSTCRLATSSRSVKSTRGDKNGDAICLVASSEPDVPSVQPVLDSQAWHSVEIGPVGGQKKGVVDQRRRCDFQITRADVRPLPAEISARAANIGRMACGRTARYSLIRNGGFEISNQQESRLMDHRGCLQAQGGDIEESESWTQDNPLLLSNGHQKLNILHDKLNPAEQGYRQQAFAQAGEFMERAADAGGAGSGTRKSFPQRPRRDQRRIDIEVIKGLAFVRSSEDKT
jgi:hypothetical protein